MLKEYWFRSILLLTIINLIFAGNIYSQTTYYVDATNGNDLNSGTSATQAWKTLDAITNYKGFQAGDIVRLKRGETFIGKPAPYFDAIFRPPINGLHFKTYGSNLNHAIIDGQGKYSPLWLAAAYSRNNLSFDSLKFFNPGRQSSDDIMVVRLEGANDITFTNCIFDANNNSAYSGKRLSAATFQACKRIVINNCIIENVSDEHGLYFGGGEDNVVEHSIIRDISDGGVYFSNNIGNLSDVSNRAIVRYNWFENCGRSYKDFGGDSNLFAYNVIILKRNDRTSTHGVYISHSGSGGNIPAKNGRIYNNTFIALENAAPVRFIELVNDDVAAGYEVKNNIFYSLKSPGGSYNRFFYRKRNNGGTDFSGMILPQYSNNLYYSVNSTANWSSNEVGFTFNYSSLANWQLGQNQDENSFYSDPKFVGGSIENYYTLKKESPAIDAGVTVFDFNNNILSRDFYGNPIVGKPDIGAFEYQSGVTVLAPVANFSANNLTPNNSQTVTFTDASTNSPTSWQWAFSPSSVSYVDGTSSTSKNPHVKFNSATSYTVTLTARNSSGSDNEVKTNYITVTTPIIIPVAAFSANNLTPNTSQTVTFTDASTNSPTSWQWTFSPSSVSYVDGTSSTSKNPHIKFNSAVTYSCTLRVSNSAGSDQLIKTNFISASPEVGVLLDVSIYLSGCYTNNSMLTGLNDQSFLPTSQPFNAAPWNYTGTEKVLNGFYPGIVDWVLLELRTDVSPSSRVIRRAGLVSSKGKISEVVRSGFYFKDLPAGEYYIVVHHRNHLSVMSSQKVYLSSNPVLYDFRNSQSKAYGNNSMQNLGDGNFGLYSGDGNSDGTISNDDIRDIWIPEFLTSVDGYLQGDFNMDGSVTASDNNIYWLPNNGKTVGFSN